MKKCPFCGNDVKYKQDSINGDFGTAHTVCNEECNKREFEERCLCCNSEIKDDYECSDNTCDGKTFKGYKGPGRISI